MTLKLYFGTGACSFVPHALLEAAGAEFEPVMLKLHRGEQESPEFLAINPRGQVPVLVDDGQVITQIVAIALHIDAKFPQMRFLPRETLARTRAIETLMWMNNTVHPTFTHVFRSDKFAEAREAQADIKAVHVKRYAALLDEMQAILRLTGDKGLDWLSGDAFGPLDAYLLTLTRWAGLAGLDPTSFPGLWAHVQKVAALPPVARVIERERLQLNVYKAS